ncbi:MAG TPA: class I SAM-dependent rRNA methyltransferase, partial [Novosphingobium sp.]|nr:class I SAM-dependent rRNA methyltransferase [Novosphingobium sp.]
MAALSLQPLLLTGEGWADYGLVDSGAGRKLERYGPMRFIRPEPQA